MNQPVQRIDEDRCGYSSASSSRHLSFLRFLLRYPIFLLAFGPPLFRSASIDATKKLIDFWSVLQVGLLSSIALRAILRLAFAQAVFVPKQIRSVLKYWFFLGLLYLGSVVYSPSRLVSMAYSVIYFLEFACVVEFVVDISREPPEWIQFLFHLRLIAFLLVVVVLLTLPFAPALVLSVVPGAGIRLQGITVAPMSAICPMIAIISAYSFLHGLESRVRSVFFFLIGLAGELSTQTRGSELALLLCLAILGAGWAKTGRRTAYLFISCLMAFILFSGVLMGAVGGSRVWNIFNRGQDAQGIASASGRTDIWKFAVQYCLAHPQGMGYVAGFRMKERDYFAFGALSNLTGLGNAHNTYLQVLSDAGWLAMAIYLIILVKVIHGGWRFARAPAFETMESDSPSNHTIRCVLVLLVFFLANGMDSADCVVPLRAMFYWQNIAIAVILGISARLPVNTR